MLEETSNATTPARGGMFSQLMPLVAERTILITVARVDDRTLCVNFVPKQLKTVENDALSTPLCVTGAPEELDRELVAQLKVYVAGHVALSSNLAEIQKEMDEAAKKAREESRKKNGKNWESKGSSPPTYETKKGAEPLNLFEHGAATASGGGGS
jgi:PRTRC genetic system protein E